jgi:hypothetical protein
MLSWKHKAQLGTTTMMGENEGVERSEKCFIMQSVIGKSLRNSSPPQPTLLPLHSTVVKFTFFWAARINSKFMAAN